MDRNDGCVGLPRSSKLPTGFDFLQSCFTGFRVAFLPSFAAGIFAANGYKCYPPNYRNRPRPADVKRLSMPVPWQGTPGTLKTASFLVVGCGIEGATENDFFIFCFGG